MLLSSSALCLPHPNPAASVTAAMTMTVPVDHPLRAFGSDPAGFRGGGRGPCRWAQEDDGWLGIWSTLGSFFAPGSSPWWRSLQGSALPAAPLHPPGN